MRGGRRHRVEATVAPGVAAQQAARGQVSTCCCTMLVKRVERVARAGRLEAAGAAEPGAQEETVGADRRGQQAARPEHRRRRIVHRRMACANNSSSSPRTAPRSASEAALRNCCALKAPRWRIITWRPAHSVRRRRMASRIWRFTKLRVAARLACRFGTTKAKPSGEASRPGELSTDSVMSGATPVGNSSRTCAFGAACKTKCVVFETVGAESSAFKASPPRATHGEPGERGTAAAGRFFRPPGACGLWRGAH